MHPPAGDATAVTAVVRSRAGRTALLRESLYSVAALAQAEARAVVVLDSADAAHRDEVEALRGHLAGLLELDVVDDAPPGFAGAARRGLDEVSTARCCLLDDGEVLYPRHAAALGAALEADRGAVAAYGGGRLARGAVTGAGFVARTRTAWPAERFGRARLLREPCVALCATLVRTDAARDAAEVLDTAPAGLADWVLLRRLALRGRLAVVDRAVCEHRVDTADPAEWPFIAVDPADPLVRAVAGDPGEVVAGTVAAELGGLWDLHRETMAAASARAGAGDVALAGAREHAEWLERRVEELERRLDEATAPPASPARSPGWTGLRRRRHR